MQAAGETPTAVANGPGQDAVATKQDLAQQLAASSTAGDGGIISQLTSNPFFTAGFGLAGLGAVATFATRGLRNGAALIKRRLLVDVEINIRDPSYEWFLFWMTRHEQRRLAVKGGQLLPEDGVTTKPGVIESILERLTPGMRQLSITTHKIELENGSMQANFALVPGTGWHVLRYNNAFIGVNRQREMKQFDREGKPWETVTLTTLYSQRHVFEDMFREAHLMAAQQVEGKTVIYNVRGFTWERFGNPRQKRPLDSVILDEGVKERIVGDVQDFMASAKWYADRGIPYRRGYLLFGPPGTGKSSFIQALAGHFDYDIAILNLSERGLTDDKLNHLLTLVPKRTFILLEDVDVAWGNRREQNSEGYSGANVTMSGLLNALDGVASAEERIIFLTTNHVGRLDEALIRPGRVDMAVNLDKATQYQIEQLWNRFYEDIDSDGSMREMFVSQLRGLNILAKKSATTTSTTSTAALQGLFLYNKDNPQGAIEMAWQLAPGEMANAIKSKVGNTTQR